MRGILFLSDSVNRRFLKIYEESGMRLPNIERLAKRSAVFENHWTGSAPCMPARRDIMTGRLNFLERNWGPIEPFDCTLPRVLRSQGIRSHIVTDHYHYFEIGGENYCQMFDSWELVRGQEWDPWVTQLEPKEMPEHLGKMVPQYWYNREAFKDSESRYPSVVTMDHAAQWLKRNHSRDDFFLWIEPFDPHEPFDVPKRYLDAVADTYDGTMYMWPEYKQTEAAGIDEKALAHIRKRYLALLLMTDTWLGRIFDVMDRYGMWEDTMFIYTTDHGYMLGEHGYLAKNYMPAYNEVFHLPLMIHLPGDEGAGTRISALTQNIDLFPTLMEYYHVQGKETANKLHGSSLLPLIRGEKKQIRKAALYGYFGKQMNITDGRYTYFKSPVRENRPLNLYTAMPTDIRVYFDEERLSDLSKITAGRYLSWTPYPVYRIPADIVRDNDDGTLRYVWLYEWEQEDQLYDLRTDYEQLHNLAGREEGLEARMTELMKQALTEHDAPSEQFVRLGLGSGEGKA